LAFVEPAYFPEITPG